MAGQEKGAGVLVFRREEKEILFLLLFKIKYGTGYWDLVKGRMEPGETALQTARRESQEETALADLQFVSGFEEKLAWQYRLDGTPVKKTVTYYLAETKSVEVTISPEHKKSGWFTLAEAEKVLNHNDTKELLRKAQKFLDKHS